MLPETDPGVLTHVVELVHAHRAALPRAGAVSGTAVLAMAYGTPAGPEELEAYYTHIRRGRPPTPELLAELRAAL